MVKKKEENVEVAEKVEAPKKLKVEIIRGRMPVQVVNMIRFHNDADMTKSTLAELYRTTVGKINDIVAGNNFGYVSEKFKPTQDQLDDAKEYIDKCDNKDLTDLVNSFDVASDDEAKSFEDARKASRKVRKKSDTPTPDELVEVDDDDDDDDDDDELLEDDVDE